jgi:hypothetical protein
MILFKDRRIRMMIAIVIGTIALNGNMSRRGKPSEGYTPNFISKRVTMLSEAMRAFLDAEAFLRAVLRPVSSSMAVARASAIEHAFPCLMWDAHRRAIAMLVIFEREAILKHLKHSIILIVPKRRKHQRRLQPYSKIICL